MFRSLSCSPRARRKIGDPSDKVRVFTKFDNGTISNGSSKQIATKFESIPCDSPIEEVVELKVTLDESTTSSPAKVPVVPKPGVLRSILKRAHSAPKKIQISKRKESVDRAQQPLNSPTHVSCCHPFVDKIKTMADKQLHKVTHKRSIKRTNLDNDNKIVLQEEQKILKLKESPRAERREFASYVEKRDSDEIMEIIELDESPSEVRKRRDEAIEKRSRNSSIVVPDEIIEIEDIVHAVEKRAKIQPVPEPVFDLADDEDKEPTIAELLEEEFKNEIPRKAPRRQKEHVYEDIDNPDDIAAAKALAEQIDPVEPVIPSVVHTVKVDDTQIADIVATVIESLDAIEEPITIVESKPPTGLAPISSTESTSSEEADDKVARLSAVTEESDQLGSEILLEQQSAAAAVEIDGEAPIEKEPEIKSVLKGRESSLGPDKRVTFSASTEEREEESTKEDVSLPDHITVDRRWSKMR